MNLTIKDHREHINEEILKNIVDNAKSLQEDTNLFITINDNIKLNSIDSPLANVLYTAKDNISTKGVLTTAGSNTLNDYVPIYDATVIKKLNELGALCLGKTNMDELGMGASGLTSFRGSVKNNLDLTRIAGGSSAGSAVSISSNLVPFSLGSDTGDSIRKPASYCGVVGYKPTYGLISRYGLIPFASSMDHIGVFSNNVFDAALVVNNIKGLDPKDMTTFDSNHIDLLKDLKEKFNKQKLFFIKELLSVELYPEEKELIDKFHEFINELKSQGIEIEEISIDNDILKALKPAYDVISCAEATSNCSNLNGIAFGPRDKSNDINEMIVNFRTNGFSSPIKKRFVIGSYVLQKENQQKYYMNSCRLRAMIVSIMKEHFTKFDALILPASGSIAPKIDGVNETVNKNNKPLENHMVIGNFGGFPSITIPFTNISDMPIGINITADIFKDANLLNIAYNLEEIISKRGDL